MTDIHTVTPKTDEVRKLAELARAAVANKKATVTKVPQGATAAKPNGPAPKASKPGKAPKAEAAPKASKPGKAGTKRASKYPLDAKIKLIVSGNPKREGTAAFTKYAAFKDGMTVAQYYAAPGNGGVGEINWCLRHNFLTVG